MKLQKQSFGKYVRLEIVADTHNEVMSWRDYYWNWAAIKVTSAGYDCSIRLDDQEREVDELSDGYHLAFYVTRESVIKAYQASMEMRIKWEKIHGHKYRQQMHKRIERAAQRRFERIPSSPSQNETKPDCCLPQDEAQ